MHPHPAEGVAPEGAREHLANALQLVRVFLDLGELMVGTDGPGILVPVAGLDVQRRLEVALERLPVREAVFERRTREYPLHTTGDLGQLPAYLRDPSRSAVWVHVYSAHERAWAQAHVAAAGGWRLINPPAVPEFFVVAVRESVAPPVVERLVRLVRPHQSADDVRFLGRLFGYSPDDIEWYCRVTQAD